MKALLCAILALAVGLCGYAAGVAVERQQNALWHSVIASDVDRKISVAVFNERLRLLHGQLALADKDASIDAMHARQSIIAAITEAMNADCE